MEARRSTVRRFTATLAAVTLVACGGSSSSNPNPNPGMGAGTGAGVLAGAAVKGPVSGATVTAFAIANGSKGQQLGSATTDPQGRFSIGIGSSSGPVMMELSGGSYTDEATGTTMPMAAGDVMRALVPAVAAGASTTGLVMTPLTSMAAARAQAMAGGMTDANAAAANGDVGRFFMVGDILRTMPMDPLAQGSGAAATQDAKNYGMVIAGMTQYAHTLGMTTSSGMVTAMMDDASDGVMDGRMGSTPIAMSGMGGMMGGGMMQGSAGTSSLASAMSQFMASGMNRSGVAASELQPLLDKLGSSSGAIR